MPFPSPPETNIGDWTMVARWGNEEVAVDQWISYEITDTPDGPTARLELNALHPAAAYIRELVTDILWYRNKQLLYRTRVVDSNDTLTHDGHTVSFECVGYERLLARRILRTDLTIQDEDIDAAWRLIDYTQAFGTLGITRGTLTAGTMRYRALTLGTSIFAAIDDFATANNGFDWWIDQNLAFRAQKPRRGKTHDIEWGWGDEVAEGTREMPAENYSSVILAIGARNETRIPKPGGSGEDVYAPPTPQLRQLSTKPLGVWETSVSYSDIVTPPSLAEKADWTLNEQANMRPTYRFTLGPGMWNPVVAVGDILAVRIASPPRLDIRVLARIEELSISGTVDGDETVSVSMRAEVPETFITPPPLGPIPTAPTYVPDGKTMHRSRLRPWDDVAAILRGYDQRLQRQEHIAATAAGAGGNFVFTQSSASATWVVAHNLNAYPSVTVESGGDTATGEIAYNSANQLTLTFSAAISGTAYLS